MHLTALAFCIQLKKRELESLCLRFATGLPVFFREHQRRSGPLSELNILSYIRAMQPGFKDNKQEAAARFLLSAINDQD